MKLVLRLISESFSFAWQALVVNKLRTLLSLLGVTIGIFSIIFVLSVVDSMEADMKSSLDTIGSDLVFIQKWPMGPEEGDEEYAWWKYMRRRQPSLQDMDLLRKKLSGFDAIAFQTGNQKTAQYKNNYAEFVNALGVSHEYRSTINLTISEGRYFSEIESEGGKNVAIIGQTIAQQLFGNDNPIHKDIKVGGLRVEVIGVLEKEGASLFGNGTDYAIIMPISFAIRLMDIREQDCSIFVKAKEGVSVKELKNEVQAVFREVRKIKPGAENDFSIIESAMISNMVESVVGVFNSAGMIIGVFAILVGAFSIANIMFVNVKERTAVIGIQKSFGAKNYFILLQFLFESVALSLIGGAIGLFFVWLATLGLNAMMDMTFILPWHRVLMGMGIAAVVGVISGIIPANTAARLNPVEAMRSK